MKSDSSLGQSSWAFTEATSFDVVSLLGDPDDISRTEAEVRALIHEGRELLSIPTDATTTEPENKHVERIATIRESSEQEECVDTGAASEIHRETALGVVGTSLLFQDQGPSGKEDQIQPPLVRHRVASDTFEAGHIPYYIETMQTRNLNNVLLPANGGYTLPSKPPTADAPEPVTTVPVVAEVAPSATTRVQCQHLISGDLCCINLAKPGTVYCELHLPPKPPPPKLAPVAPAMPSTTTCVQCEQWISADLCCINLSNPGTRYCGLHLPQEPPKQKLDLSTIVIPCQAVLPNGIRCINLAKGGLLFCKLHYLECTNTLPTTGSRNNPCCADANVSGLCHCSAEAFEQERVLSIVPFQHSKDRMTCPAKSVRGNRCGQVLETGQTCCSRHQHHGSSGTGASIRCASVIAGKQCHDMAKKGKQFCSRHSSTALVPLPTIPDTKTIALCSGFKSGKPCPNMCKQGSTVCRQHEGACSGITPAQFPSQATSTCCSSTTKTGKRCVDPAMKGSLHCFNHAQNLARKHPGTGTASSPLRFNKNRTQCRGIVAATGTRCKDKAKKGGAFCGKHATTSSKGSIGRTADKAINEDTHVVLSKEDLKGLIQAAILEYRTLKSEQRVKRISDV